jgi:5-methylcytosine-specific restriction endonuclease McrA
VTTTRGTNIFRPPLDKSERLHSQIRTASLTLPLTTRQMPQDAAQEPESSLEVNSVVSTHHTASLEVENTRPIFRSCSTNGRSNPFPTVSCSSVSRGSSLNPVARKSSSSPTSPRSMSDDSTPARRVPPCMCIAPRSCTSRRPVPAPAPTFLVEPLAPARYRVQFTAGAELHEKLERLRSLMRSQVPDGDLAAIIEQAVTEKLERLEARRFGLTKKPRTSLADTDTSRRSRYIPAAVKRTVSERDGRQCHYRNEQGRRCSERNAVQLHHVYPYGFGGDHRPLHLRFLCEAHNRLMAERDYGRAAMERKSGSTLRARSAERGHETSSGTGSGRVPFGP